MKQNHHMQKKFQKQRQKFLGRTLHNQFIEWLERLLRGRVHGHFGKKKKKKLGLKF